MQRSSVIQQRATKKVRDAEPQLLTSNSQALASRLKLIRSAKHEILLSTYIFSGDGAGMRIAAALRHAAKAGVHVRLLVDGQGTRLKSWLKKSLETAGVHIGVYNPLSLKSVFRPLLANQRMHDKLLIVDGATGITGGRNVGDSYLRDSGSFVKTDLDVVVTGRVVRQARAYFRQLWRSPNVKSRAGVASGRFAVRRGRDTSRTMFASDSPRDGKAGIRDAGNGAGQLINKMIASADSEVLIRTPYLIPTKETLATLKEAVERGVKVKVFTNSFKTRDTVLSQLGYEASFKELAKIGIEIHEFRNSGAQRTARHEKAVVVDGKRAFIGSHNMDPRSENLNRETGVVVESRALAAKLGAQTQELRESSSLVASGGKIFKSAKRVGCGFGCRMLSQVVSPLLRRTGLIRLL